MTVDNGRRKLGSFGLWSRNASGCCGSDAVARARTSGVDRVRVDEANRLRHDRLARRLVKSALVLLRNRENVTSDADPLIACASRSCWRPIVRY
jgi:hypothetical protein